MRMSMTRKDFQTIAEHIHNALDNDTDIMEGLLRSFEVINPAFSRNKFIKRAIPEKLYIARPFNIGDIVVGIGEEDGLDIDGEHGVIVKSDNIYWHVEFDNKFSPRLHGARGRDWVCSEEAIRHA